MNHIIPKHFEYKWNDNLSLYSKIEILEEIFNELNKHLMFYKLLKKKNCKKRKKTSSKRRCVKKFIDFLIETAKEEQKLYLNSLYEINSIEKYRYLARFNITDPIIFNNIKGITNYNKHGFYSKNNINGVVKDHKVSIKYGFDNKIDPLIIGHPANCEFLFYYQNSIKSSNNSISFERLLLEIKEFNKTVKSLKSDSKVFKIRQ